MNWTNIWSGPVALLLLVVLGWLVVRRRGYRKRDVAVLVVTLAVLVGAWFWFKPPATSTPLDDVLGRGQPVLLEVQSPFCLGCIAMRPTVDRIEQQWAGRLRVLRVNYPGAEAQHLAERYRLRMVPSFILFDATGREHWRATGQVDETIFHARIAELLPAL